MPHRVQRQPIEQAFAPRQFGQHHHADQEQVTSRPSATAPHAVCSDTAPSSGNTAAAPSAHTYSGMRKGRNSRPRVATATAAQIRRGLGRQAWSGASAAPAPTPAQGPGARSADGRPLQSSQVPGRRIIPCGAAWRPLRTTALQVGRGGAQPTFSTQARHHFSHCSVTTHVVTLHAHWTRLRCQDPAGCPAPWPWCSASPGPAKRRRVPKPSPRSSATRAARIPTRSW